MFYFLISFLFIYRRRIIYAVRKRGNIYGRHSLVSEIFVVAWIQVMIYVITSKALFPLRAAKWFNKLFWSQSVSHSGLKGGEAALQLGSYWRSHHSFASRPWVERSSRQFLTEPFSLGLSFLELVSCLPWLWVSVIF